MSEIRFFNGLCFSDPHQREKSAKDPSPSRFPYYSGLLQNYSFLRKKKRLLTRPCPPLANHIMNGYAAPKASCNAGRKAPVLFFEYELFGPN